ETRNVGSPGFNVLLIDPIVPDERVSHGHDLAFVRRIGEDLLISGHRGIEAYLATHRCGSAERLPAKYRAVFQRQDCRGGTFQDFFLIFSSSAMKAFGPPSIYPNSPIFSPAALRTMIVG